MSNLHHAAQQNTPARTLGFRVAQELSDDELNSIAGGRRPITGTVSTYVDGMYQGEDDVN